MLKQIALVLVATFFLIGCTQKNVYPTASGKNTHGAYNNLNAVVVSMSDQLLKSTNIKLKHKKRIALTAFVELSQFNKTTKFGRVLSESMFNELHIRGFKVLDFRGQDAISINNDGEFHLTRDISKLKPKINNAYIMVATYSQFDYNSLAINGRIIDLDSGEVISTSRTIYQSSDCRLFDLCDKVNNIKLIKE